MRYLVIFERGAARVGACVPDLPGCVAVGRTRAEAQQLIQRAIAMHIDGLRADGLPLPEPTSEAALVDVKVSD